MTEKVSGSGSTFDHAGTSKPVVLHVLHSWGGGIDFFARDLQAGDRQRKHVFLKSHSRDNLPPFGKELCLYQSLEEGPLATWHLSEPVMDTELHSIEVTRILNSIIEKWTVGAVVVSSLIGHSLDVLRTGLPTALAVHDVYPFWPLLHDANADDHSIGHLRQVLTESRTMNVFASHDAEYWLAIRDELVSLITQKHIVCISPSSFAIDRICRIDPRMAAAHWSVVPHGIGLAVGSEETFSTESSGNLKVLVPGHINGGKGELLLKELVPKLPDGIELVLLGSAHLSKEFVSEKVSTIDHYPRDKLGDFIRNIRPDIAMLPSTVPETYGYVLSEMLQSGIPVICSNIGAYAERAKYLPGITLVEPDTESFLAALVRFRDDRALLSEQKKKLPFTFPGLKEVAEIWAAKLPANAPQWLFEFSNDPGIGDEVKMNLQLTHISELLKVVHAATEKNARLSNEALSSIGRQQSTIESMLEILNRQTAQISDIFAKQNEFESALRIKDNELQELRAAFQQQVSLAQAREKASAEMMENGRLDFERKLVLISESSEADKLALSSEAESLQAKVVLLDRKLDELQSKRGWRFLKFFG